MLKKFFPFGCLLWACLLWGCVEDVFVAVNPAPEKLVISSLFIPDSLVVVTVTKSFSALTSRDLDGLDDSFIETILVRNAFVTVASEGYVDTLEMVASGVYIGSVSRPHVQETFDLFVYDSLTGYSVRSNTNLKRQVQLDYTTYDREVIDEDTIVHLNYGFRDPEEEDNWYIVQAFELPRIPDADLLDFEIDEDGEVTVRPDTTDQIFFESDLSLLFTNLISDLQIEDHYYEREIDVDRNVKDTVVFTLINVDQGYFEFLQTQRESGGDILLSLINEPVNYPTNVEDGYGYFTMHLPHYRAVFRNEDY